MKQATSALKTDGYTLPSSTGEKEKFRHVHMLFVKAKKA
jgi:hypothetical protein